MFELSSILAAVDTSLDSRAALDLATALSKVYGAKLHSTHVVHRIPPVLQQVLFPYAALGEDIEELEQELISGARERLERALSDGSDQSPVHPTHVICDHISEGLHSELMRLGPELLVMGARGDEHADGLSLGRTAGTLLRRWPGPLLLVRHSASQGGLTRILVATDLASGSEPLIEAGAALAIGLEARMSALTVLPDPRIQDPGGLLRGALRVDVRSLRGRGQKNASKAFSRIQSSARIPFPKREAYQALDVGLEVAFGDPTEEIVRAVADDGTTLLVIGRSRPREDGDDRLGRTAFDIARRAAAHVLVVPLCPS